ncbi:NRT2 ribosyltransferase, partial [Ploceus nigricollis]|nr:NRT2 ribosyltransferase [Ploceus nigricollis]
WPLPAMALLARTLVLLAMTVAIVAIKVVPLDMAWDSFDDQYRGCGQDMAKELQSLYDFEYRNNPQFAWGWDRADAEWRKRGSAVYPLESHQQAVALMTYTSQDVYKDFNAAVRVAGRSRQEYRNNFHFKTLHFLLTQALVTLWDAQNRQCRHVYRGVHDIRYQAQPGQRVRFGQFTSTSPHKNIARQFGTDTIFQVYTCYGVNIRQFSMYPGEEEVLIPPFETFNVVQVNRDRMRTWIRLQSTGTYSKHNCAWLGGDATGGSLGDG